MNSAEMAQRLREEYPDVYLKLQNWWGDKPPRDGTFEASAARVYFLGQLWLTWFDGSNFGETQCREIYDSVVRMAATPPKCSIEEEAIAHMRANASNMTSQELAMALECPVKTIGSIIVLNGQMADFESDLGRRTIRD